MAKSQKCINVVFQFYTWFKFHFPLFLGMVMYNNELKTKENKIQPKDKIEPQHKCLMFMFYVTGMNSTTLQKAGTK